MWPCLRSVQPIISLLCPASLTHRRRKFLSVSHIFCGSVQADSLFLSLCLSLCLSLSFFLSLSLSLSLCFYFSLFLSLASSFFLPFHLSHYHKQHHFILTVPHIHSLLSRRSRRVLNCVVCLYY